MNSLEKRPRVALTTGSRLRGAVARALALVADDLRDLAEPRMTLVVDPLGPGRNACPHPDAFAATLDALFAAGVDRVVARGVASDAPACFKAFGFEREAWGRPVEFVAADLEMLRNERPSGDVGRRPVWLTTPRVIALGGSRLLDATHAGESDPNSSQFLIAAGSLRERVFGPPRIFAVAGRDAAAVVEVARRLSIRRGRGARRQGVAGGIHDRVLDEILVVGDVEFGPSRGSHGPTIAAVGPHAARGPNFVDTARSASDRGNA